MRCWVDATSFSHAKEIGAAEMPLIVIAYPQFLSFCVNRRAAIGLSLKYGRAHDLKRGEQMSQTEAAVELTKLVIGKVELRYKSTNPRDLKEIRDIVIETFEACVKAVDKASSPG